jgi:NAD(P)-dependent dehydrogenase (short-subunit alcohol dehydrogenase family)
MRLGGRSALVTGGTRGIGLAITEAFLREGASVVALSHSTEQVESFRKSFERNPKARAVLADVRDRQALQAVKDGLEGLDILVANAGVNTRSLALDLGDEPLRDMIDSNILGTFLTCQVFAPLMIQRGQGRVVITSSLAANHGMNLRAVYSATKGALSALVRSLAVEWGPFGLTVNAVGPGIIRTPLTQKYMDDYPERVKDTIDNTPLRRLGEPEDVADVVTFLASHEARFVTGQTVVVDGGMGAGSAWW